MPQWEISFSPRLDLTDREILDLLVYVESHRQFANKIPLPPPIAAKLDRLNLVRQIKGTTGIEGNTLSEAEIESILSETTEGRQKKIWEATSRAALERLEVINAARVAEYIRQIAKPGGPPVMITQPLICELHRITTEGCNYEGNVPGRYRQHRVRAGDYVAPDHADIPRLMDEFVRYINSREVLSYKAPIRAILAHFYLISIHPFGDGNGRTSRALEALILYQGGYNVRGFYSLANYFYRNREEYVAQLQAARFEHHGCLQEFVRFCLKGLVEEFARVQEEILEFVRNVMFKDYITELYRSGTINQRCLSILTLLLESGNAVQISLSEYRDRTHPLIAAIYGRIKSKRTVMRDLELMKKYELITITEDNRVQANVAVMNKFT